MSSFFKDFREFATRGNVMDLAIAVIIGSAFSAIVSSLVDDVVTPLLLNPALKAFKVENIASLQWGAVKYGVFLAAVIKFLLFAFIIFLFVRTIQKLHKKKEEAAAPPPAEISSTDKLLMQIRDELKAQNKKGGA